MPQNRGLFLVVLDEASVRGQQVRCLEEKLAKSLNRIHTSRSSVGHRDRVALAVVVGCSRWARLWASSLT